MERLYADWIDDCETTGEKFVDAEFRIEDARNFGAKDAKYRRLPKKSKFIVDGIDALDVNQVRTNCYSEYILNIYLENDVELICVSEKKIIFNKF